MEPIQCINCPNTFKGIKNKEDTCPQCLKKLIQPTHYCTIHLKHAHGYQCPECYKITK